MNCEERPIPRPLPKWEGVPADEGQCVEGVTVKERGGVAPVRWADADVVRAG